MSRLPARLDGSQLQGPSGRRSSASHSVSSSSSSSEQSLFEFEEPPSHIIQMLLRYFLPHALALGFFLDPDRFYDTTLLPLPFGDTRRPSPGLLCVVYLWGIHFSNSPPPPNFSEPDLLHRARKYLSSETSSSTHIQQTIQAQAEMYASGAATLALGYRLHKIRSARASHLSIPGPMDITPPMDAVEEGERIRGFWAVTFLQTSLCLAFNSNRSFCILDSFAPEIDAPWPLEIGDYQAGVLPPDYVGQESIRHLLMDDTFPASPTCMLQIKASVFFYHVLRLPPGEPHGLASPKLTSYMWLDRRISQFWESLPPLHVFSGNVDPATVRALALTHALTAAAAIKLHQRAAAGDTAQKKCIAAARAILECLRASDGPSVHPVVGALCSFACGVLITEVRAGRAFREAWSASVGMPMTPPSTEEAALITDIRDGLSTMAVYAGESALIAHQFKLVQEQYAAM
ncbi:hypothetical protein B0H13DRAFT_2387113 [Mycena leptocephala]|nr:hypothetical protein B0H13DRAFT_2387113 [Mycena leptocephala]